MECKPLFIALLHRLRRYPEAMVLYAALEQHADEREFKTTLTQMALDILGGQVDRYQVQRALGRLHEKGLVEIRTHANYRTHIKVDRGAVEALLRTPRTVACSKNRLWPTSMESRTSSQATDAPNPISSCLNHISNHLE